MPYQEDYARPVTPSSTEFDVKCQRCTGETAHRAIVEACSNANDSDSGFSWWATYQVIQCQGCKRVSFRESSNHSETDPQDPDEETLYPPRRSVGKGLGDDANSLPDVLARLYSETANALVSQSPVLTGIGLRALVEAVCKDRRAPGRDLEAKINSLVQLGLLTPGGAIILHQIRALGNKAAHEATPHSEEQLSAAMDIVEHLLRDVFILPLLAQRLFGVTAIVPQAAGGALPS